MSELQIPEAGKKGPISRRQFLVLAGVGGAALLVGVPLVAVPYARLQMANWLEGSGGPPSAIGSSATAWFKIRPDNTVRVFLPKVEMGQGVHTALAQIAAEELDAAWEQLEVVQATTGQGLNDPVGTSASTSVSSLYEPLREAGATVRQMLLMEGARQMGREVGDLTTEQGFVVAKDDASVRRSYGEIVAAAEAWVAPEEPAAPKSPAEFRLIGQPLPRVDLRAKVLGEATFGIDVRLPGMLYGAVAHSPTLEGKLRRAAAGAASGMPGVVQVVIEEDLAGVVAETRDQAYAALQAMEVEWDPGRLWQQAELEALVTVGQGQGIVVQDEGNAAAGLRAGPVVEAEYRTPLAYQAHLEPQVAVADVREDGVTVWASTQSAMRVRDAVAEALDREPETVTVQATYLGGGFGHKVLEKAQVEAARLSQAVGRPVHLVWSRTEDFQNGFVRPMTHHVLRATLGSDGRMAAMEHQQASGAVALPFLPGIFGAIMGHDFGAWRGARIAYRVPDKRTVATVARLPVPTGWWRGLGLMANSFALESFMDEMAQAAGVDPLEFRLQHMPEDAIGQRMRTALITAAERAGWGTALPAGRGRGIACIADYGTVVTEVAEAVVEGGEIRVTRVTAAVDPGVVVNPDGAKAQVEGNIVMGLSSALLEEATVQDGALVPQNFGAYRLLTMAAAPEIEVVLLQGADKPSGLGEPPIGPLPAAVANAVYAATGTRLRRLPLRLA